MAVCHNNGKPLLMVSASTEPDGAGSETKNLGGKKLIYIIP